MRQTSSRGSADEGLELCPRHGFSFIGRTGTWPISTPLANLMRACGLSVGRRGRKRAVFGALIYRRHRGDLSSPIDSPAVEVYTFLSPGFKRIAPSSNDAARSASRL
jgi:hypothetical protein